LRTSLLSRSCSLFLLLLDRFAFPATGHDQIVSFGERPMYSRLSAEKRFWSKFPRL
jgi:hypothetical protein